MEIVIPLLILGAILLFASNQGSASPDAVPELVIEANAMEPVLQGINPADRSTWPSGDAIWEICRSIAGAEGYGPAENNPTRLCNPGDISDGASVYGSELHSGSHVTKFPDHATGWKWLYNKINNAANGRSAVYLPGMTWAEFSQKYAGDSQNWVNNVTRNLGVTPSDPWDATINA